MIRNHPRIAAICSAICVVLVLLVYLSRLLASDNTILSNPMLTFSELPVLPGLHFDQCTLVNVDMCKTAKEQEKNCPCLDVVLNGVNLPRILSMLKNS